MFVIIALFVFSCIKQFAIGKQQEYDDEEIANKIRKENRLVKQSLHKYPNFYASPAKLAQQIAAAKAANASTAFTASRVPTSPFINPTAPSTPRIQRQKHVYTPLDSEQDQYYAAAAAVAAGNPRPTTRKSIAAPELVNDEDEKPKPRNTNRRTLAPVTATAPPAETEQTKPQTRRTSLSRRGTTSDSSPRLSPHLHQDGKIAQSTADWINKRRSVGAKKQ